MLFNSFQYLYFLAAAALFFYFLPYRARQFFLLAASLFFVFFWNLLAGIVLLVQTGVAWSIGCSVARQEEIRLRKFCVALGTVLLLGSLVFFKYAGFLTDCIVEMTGWNIPRVSVPLPVGISFYTFICIGYIVDIYRKKCAAERNWMQFSLFAAFFPQVASGPISRAPNLMPQLKQPQPCDPENLAIGFRLILWGLFKKVVIADRLARFADPVFSMPENYSGFTALVAMYFFTIQIYCDFSGYSDIAIGSAKLFGINMMQNFRLPYFADSIYEFWKRWHISLTSWFRDYLYIPLGGNRVSRLRWIGNIMAVFLLSGLWHGAAWTFVIWGGIHGIVYLVELGCSKTVQRIWPEHQPAVWLKPLKILLTFHIAAAAWVFFRAPSLGKAEMFFSRFWTDWGVFQWSVSKIPDLIAFGLIGFLILAESLMVCGWSGDYLHNGKCPAWLRAAGYGLLLMGIALLGVSSDSFIYLQF